MPQTLNELQDEVSRRGGVSRGCPVSFPVEQGAVILNPGTP